MSYGFVLAWGYVHQYFSASRARDLAVARLEGELAQAQLRALKAQLQPHFLFNTLHAVTVLIRRDPEAATRTVMRLSDLLRMTLVDAERQEAPLADELRFVRLYLEIEQTRFRERLAGRLGRAAGAGRRGRARRSCSSRWSRTPSGTASSRRASGGRVTIAGERADGRLVLRVVNDGARPRVAAPHGVGARERARTARAALRRRHSASSSPSAGRRGGGERWSCPTGLTGGEPTRD